MCWEISFRGASLKVCQTHQIMVVGAMHIAYKALRDGDYIYPAAATGSSHDLLFKNEKY